jgi:hypothetical protein
MKFCEIQVCVYFLSSFSGDKWILVCCCQIAETCSTFVLIISFNVNLLMPFPLLAKGDSTDATLAYPGVNVIIFFLLHH